MKTKLLMLATSALALLGLSSCLQVENLITIKKDGSGTIVEEMVFGEQMQMMLQMAEAQGGQGAQNPILKMMDKEKAKARAPKMGEGVEFVSMEKFNDNGKVGFKTTYKFSDINKLKYSTNGALDMGGLPGAAADAAEKVEDSGMSFELVDGKLRIIQKAAEVEGDAVADAAEGAGAAADEIMPGIDDQQLEMMKGMMKGMRMVMKVNIDSGISKTDASYVEGSTITLGDIALDKILANPEKLKALQDGDFDKTKDALAGIEGVKFESKRVVEVEMK